MNSAVNDLMEGKRLLARGGDAAHPEKRFALIGSYSLDYLPPLLARALSGQPLRPLFHLGGFNQWRQELLSADSPLHAFRPDAVVLATSLEDLFPALFEGGLGTAAQRSLVEGELASLERLLGEFLGRTPSCEVYLVVPPLARVPGEAVLGPAEEARGQAALELFLSGLRSLGSRLPRLRAVDLDFLARREGLERWADDRLWYMARMRLGLEGMAALARLTAAHYEAAHRPRPKVLAVDFDNTLWGGVAGEDGVDAVELGPEGLGLAFQDFQRELLRLRATGLLLAACSRNDEKTAWEVFSRRPEMLLKREHFSAVRIDWKDKADNLAELAAELGLGIESFVFLDDDPVQRAEVRARLPAAVPEMPQDPCRRPRWLRELPALRRLALTAEDAERGRLYEERAGREDLKRAAGSLEEFLADLKQEARFLPLASPGVPRAAQLCGKTNQFNLTTRRYDEGALSALLSDSKAAAFTLALKDRFGDNGVVGLGILRLDGAAAEIDTLLLSCRVLGRKVEDAFLAFLAGRAKALGAKTLLGRYLPTPKNGLVKDFYPARGFAPGPEDGLFSLDLSFPPVFPDAISIEENAHARSN